MENKRFVPKYVKSRLRTRLRRTWSEFLDGLFQAWEAFKIKEDLIWEEVLPDDPRYEDASYEEITVFPILPFSIKEDDD